MDIRRPIWMQRVRAPGAEAFALLFALESLARGLIVSILPIEALKLLGSAQQVSVLFFTASLCGLAATLVVPWLVRKTARRWIYSLGVVVLGCAPLVMIGGTHTLLTIGMMLRVAGVVMMTVCLSLYILDHVARSDFSRSEPMRLFYAAAAWMIGPATGAWLSEVYGSWAAYLASAAVTLVILGYFWHLRIRDDRTTHNPTLTRFKGRSPNPVVFVRRFFTQPRLVFAWMAALGRYVWWVMFFVYVPIYIVEAGMSRFTAGLVVSLGAGMLYLLPLFARGVRRYGIRLVMVSGFATSSLFTLTMGLAAEWPPMVIAALFVALLGMVSLDAVANMPFMLAVRKGERSEMTSVYSTYRDLGEISAPGIFAVLLKFFALPVVFFFTGGLMLLLSNLSRGVHPKLGRGQPRQPRPATQEATVEPLKVSGG